MKSWIISVLAVTFLSGASTGYLVGQKNAASETQPTWLDQNIEQLRRDGVTDEALLEEAREVYREYHRSILAMRNLVNELMRDRLQAISDEAEFRINAITEQGGVSADDGK